MPLRWQILLWLGILGWFIPHLGIAQEESLALGSELEGESIGIFGEYYIDESGQGSLQEIIAIPREQWIKKDRRNPNFGVISKPVWGRFLLVNTGQQKRHLRLVYNYAMADYVSFFVKTPEGSLNQAEGGDHNPQVHGWEDHRVPSIRWESGPGISEVYVKLNTLGMSQFDLTLWDEDRFSSFQMMEHGFFFLFFGILVSMLVYNGFLALILSEKTYWIYLAFSLTMLMNSMISTGYLLKVFPSWLWIQNEGYPFLGGGIIPCLASLFSIYYLDLRLAGRKIYYAWLIVIAASLFCMILGLFQTSLGSRVMIYTALSVSLLSLFTGTYFSWKGVRIAFFYTLAWSSLAMATICRSLYILGILHQNFFSDKVQVLGAGLEVLLLSLALGHKMRTIQKSYAGSIVDLNRELQDNNEQLRAEIDKRKIAEEARKGLEEDLRNELQTKMLLVSDLAHRTNNPLNHCMTNVDASQVEMQVVEKKVNSLFESIEESQELKVIKKSFEDSFQRRNVHVQLAREAISHTASAIREIRAISGVDGHALEYLSPIALLAEAYDRMAVYLDQGQTRTLKIVESSSSELRFLGGRMATILCLELVLKHWAQNDNEDLEVSVRSEEKHGKYILLFERLRSGGQAASSQELFSILNHLQKPYGKFVSFDSQVFAIGES